MIKNRVDAKVLLLSARRETIRNIIGIIFGNCIDANDVAKVLGCSVRRAEKIIQTYSEWGVIEAKKKRKWIIVEVNNYVKDEIIRGVAGIVNRIRRETNKDKITIVRGLIKSLGFNLTVLKALRIIYIISGVNEVNVPRWGNWIYDKVIQMLKPVQMPLFSAT